MKFLLLFSLIVTGAAHAQQETCGLRTMTESLAPIYPPIARAAHVQGTVILLVNFNNAGQVENANVVSGPVMLRSTADQYVRSWQANFYTGPRTCPVVITFELTSGGCELDTTVSTFRTDIQHVAIRGVAPITCDPSMTTVRRKKKFVFF